MKIELHEILIRDLVEGYVNSDEEGVVGYGGKLNIRPKYQREFVYKDKQRDAVIDTVRKNFPLNVMYWVVSDDGNYEVLDGQQRTISICEYYRGHFSINDRYFHNLTEAEKEEILYYKLMIYICEGTDREKLDWFKTINIAGEKLTDQELRNAVYTGAWLSDAKKYFSKSNCPAKLIAEEYMSGSPIRQEYLETVLDWISGGEIQQYMARYQHKDNASKLWQYFQMVIAWVKAVFPKYRKEMKGIAWGRLYNTYKDGDYDSTAFEKRISELMQDDDVSKKSGIYEYLLDGKEKHLSIRAFTPSMKRSAYERQKGECPYCVKANRAKVSFEFFEMEADHIIPWSQGGKTEPNNCQMLCKEHNREKSDK
ncbi:MAG: DUF262 domain-containing protein [Clostridia bacterium]|nr:DUF262 domain-containing protein [Clostridia bacterium]